MGLVNRASLRGGSPRALDQTLELACRVAANDPLAVKLTKRAINRSLEIGGMREALAQALELNVIIETSETRGVARIQCHPET